MEIICDGENGRFVLEECADRVASDCVGALNEVIANAGVLNISFEDVARGLKDSRVYFGLSKNENLKKAVTGAFESIFLQVGGWRINSYVLLLYLCGGATFEKIEAALCDLPLINRDVMVNVAVRVDESLAENAAYVIAAEKQS